MACRSDRPFLGETLGDDPDEPMDRAGPDLDTPLVPPAMGRLGKNPEDFSATHIWINQKNLS